MAGLRPARSDCSTVSARAKNLSRRVTPSTERTKGLGAAKTKLAPLVLARAASVTNWLNPIDVVRGTPDKSKTTRLPRSTTSGCSCSSNSRCDASSRTPSSVATKTPSTCATVISIARLLSLDWIGVAARYCARQKVQHNRRQRREQASAERGWQKMTAQVRACMRPSGRNAREFCRAFRANQCRATIGYPPRACPNVPTITRAYAAVNSVKAAVLLRVPRTLCHRASRYPSSGSA